MGKAEQGSTKFIANRIKAKGLQKLSWYCQVCQKQCRDENGYKCHTQSPSHLRNLENLPEKTQQFSKQFQRDFVYLLKTSHGTKPINANKFYGEYIQNKDHLHMNATRWKSLGSFLRSLEDQGICTIGEDELGSSIAYIRTKRATSEPEEERTDEIKLQIDRALAESESIDLTQPQNKPTEQPAELVEQLPMESTEIAFTLPKAKKRRTATTMTPL